MSKNAKTGLVSLLGGLGVIGLVIGIFTDIYSLGIGLIIFIAFGVASGVLAKMLGVKKD